MNYTEIASRKNLAIWLDVQPNKLNTYGSRYGMPKSCKGEKHGTFKTLDVCRWLIGFLRKCKTRINAQKILKFFEKEEGTASKPKSKSTKLRFNNEKGLVAAIDRARTSELQLSLKVQEAYDNDNTILASTLFDDWQKTQNVLIKMEKEFDGIQKARGSVVNLEECGEVFFSMINPVKAQMKSMGPDLSLDLAGMSDPREIADYITLNVRKIWQHISKEGFNEV